MIYMTSTATNTGAATINVYFRQGTDPDMSVVNVTEPRELRRRGCASGRSHEGGRDGAQASEQFAEGHIALFARRPLRCQLPDQLHEDQHRASDVAYRGRGRGEYLGRQLFAAHLARSVEDGAVRTDALGYRRGAGRAECGVPDGDAGS